MGITERRHEIMKALYRRKHDIVSNLAFEFGVSEKTIRRDIHVLSLTNPIYTQPGRYGGGVFVIEGCSISKIHLSSRESEVLHKLDVFIEMNEQHFLTNEEIKTFRKILNDYTISPRTDKSKLLKLT